jgi:DNA-binding NarL/FixJ family response regulator
MPSPAESFLHSQPIDLGAANILLVDDKTPFRELVRAALGTRARSLRDAASVEEAMDVLLRDGADIHCIVCDWNILPIGGLELLRMIRCRTLPPASPRMPVVVLTSRTDPDAVKTAMELDVNGFLVAPASLEKLVRTVSGAMSRTWLLQGASHYASVPGIVPPPSPVGKITLSVAEPARRLPRKTTPPLMAKAFGRRGDASGDGVGKAKGLRNVRMCILDDVSPGVVLARDLRDRDGHMLAPSGTELDPSILERLKNVGYALSDSYYVWVGDR